MLFQQELKFNTKFALLFSTRTEGIFLMSKIYTTISLIKAKLSTNIVVSQEEAVKSFFSLKLKFKSIVKLKV